MKVPVPPPEFDELLQSVTASHRFPYVVKEGTPEGHLTQKYLAWDTLRHKRPPGDLTHEEWWFAVKWARRSAQRTIAELRDNSGRPFNYTLPDEVLEAIEHINRSASGSIAIDELVTNPSTRDRYIVSSLIEEAITSSQLEGASTSRRVAKEMIRSGRPPGTRSERMILNNYLAMRRITELQDERITPELICEIHRIVTEDTLDDPAEAGHVQDGSTQRVAVWGDGDQLLHSPPPVDELAHRMRELCDFANGGRTPAYMPPVLRALAVHFMLGYDHYFSDGNGRTARAVFYWVMLRQGYWLTEFLTISRILKQAPAQYARSFLLTEQDDGDLTHFFLYHLKILRRAIEDLHAHLREKAEELRRLQQALTSTPGEFNYRQLALLERALEDPASTFSAQAHAVSHNVSGETARQDLQDLERRALLVRSKAGRRHVWRPAPELSQRLGAT